MNKSGLRAGLERQTQEQQKEKSLLSAFVTRPTTWVPLIATLMLISLFDLTLGGVCVKYESW
jgi:hypothetical protein